MRRLRLGMLIALVFTVLPVMGGRAAFADGPTLPRDQAAVDGGEDHRLKIASALTYFLKDTAPLRMAKVAAGAASQELRPQAAALVRDGVVDLDGASQIQVVIKSNGDPESLLAAIEALGARVERIDRLNRSIQTRVDPAIISSIAALGSVTAIKPPVYGHVNAGTKMTQGDALLNLDDMRAALGVDGAGVTVGVISDGIKGLQSARDFGDLPPTTLTRNGSGVLIQTSGGVVSQSFRADLNLEGGLSGSGGAEGTAILEIVHDIAPGAQLMFANFQTGSEFDAAVNWLAANADVVIDDISFFGLAYDQSSHVSVNTAEELNRPGNRIRAYFTSAGNYSQRHWEGPFVSGGTCHTDAFTTCQQFSGNADTTDFQGAGSKPYNRIKVSRNTSISVYLSWAEPYGTASGNYNLYIIDESNGAIAAKSEDNNIADDPTEQISFVNSSGSDKWYRIRITNNDGFYPARNMELYVFGGVQQTDGNRLNFNTRSGSIPAQSDAGGGVISVGAINSSDTQIDTIAPYSSWGPTNNGALKPEVTAIDCVQVTGVGGFGSNFCGTSAAAPHAAAMAALMLQARPWLMAGEPGDKPAAERALLRRIIMGTSVDLGDPGLDNVFGAGRIDGLVAGNAIVNAEPAMVPSVSTWGLAAAAAAFALLFAVRARRRRATSL